MVDRGVNSMGKFHEDLVQALNSMNNPTKDGKANYSTYTTLPNVINVAKDTLQKHNLALTQFMMPDPDRLVTRIIHSSGEYIEDGGVNLIYIKNNVQSMGSAITYARRYGLNSLLGIVGDKDDDGIMATHFEDLPEKQQTPEQKEKHEKMEEQTIDLLDPESIKENLQTFLSKIRVYGEESINNMGIDDAIEAKDSLRQYWVDNEQQRKDLRNSEKPSSKETLNWLTEKISKTGTLLKNRIKEIEESKK